MASLGDIVIGLQMNAAPFAASAQSAPGSLSSIAQSASNLGAPFARGVQSAMGSLNSLASRALGIAGQFASMLGVGSAVAGLGWGVKLAADAEQTQIAFEVMLHSGDAAKAMLADLKAYADKSPFDSIVTNESAKKLLNYGLQAQDVMPTIRMLGDVAAGDANKFDQLATAFGQMSATGRLMGQDLNQFINAGFNPLQVIAQQTGESMANLKKRMEAGGISTREVAAAFKTATSEGGQFYQMTERQASTMAGRYSTLKDNVNTALREIGEAIITNFDLSGALDHVNEFTSLVPLGVRNASSVIQVASIDWQLYIFELVPAAETAMSYIASAFVAGWAASEVGFNLFVQNLTSGLMEIKNLAMAVWEAIKAGISAIASGQNPLTASMDAFQKTLASQTSAAGGENFAVGFAQTFQKTFKDSMEGFQTHSLGESLKEQRETLLKGIGEAENARTLKPLAAPGDLGASFNGDTASKEKKGKERDTLALAGTKEAAEIMLRGVGGPEKKTESLLAKQVDLTGQLLVAFRQNEPMKVEEVTG